MVAQRDPLPQDKHQGVDVDDVLASNPDIRRMVEKIAGHAATSFMWLSIELDTRQYEEWDPPLRLLITSPYFDRDKWAQQYQTFMTWLADLDGYDPDRLFVMVIPHAMTKAEQ